MTLFLAICVTVVLSVSVYLILGRELKEVAMGLFLLGHAAHLSILMMSGTPVLMQEQGGAIIKGGPVLGVSSHMVDPLPQALILTAIVISFAVMAFLLTLLVVMHRRADRLDVNDLASEGRPQLLTEL